ncbi:MAG TPA: C45 family peptidase [Anaerolineaceae bacterium]|nr:C45 family peptidase [Anaerolineaceae bacterium]
MTPRTIQLINVYGSHRQIGQQIGEACHEQVAQSIENAHHLLSDAYDELQLTWDGTVIQARKYGPFAEERYPKCIDELKGIAEGANVRYDDLMVVNAMEAVTTDALHLTKCTSMAVSQERTANGRVLIAHNEDWLPDDEPNVFLIRGKPDNEPSFLAMTYGGLLPNIGFNSAGIAQCCDSVYPSDSRIGIPRVIVSRAVLAARTPSEAMRHMLTPQRAAGYNHLLAHESGEIYSVEVSARQFAILYAENGYMVHTNHYLDPRMQEVESEPDELISTRVRYFRALRLLQSQPKLTVNLLQLIQKDHINYPDSICNHDEDGEVLDRQKTITALVMDLTNRQMHIAWGNPCCNPYATFQLDE